MYYYYPVKYADISLLKRVALNTSCEFVKKDLGLNDYVLIPISERGDKSQSALKSAMPIAGRAFWNFRDANFIVVDQEPEQLIKTVLHEARHRWQSIHSTKSRGLDMLEQDACDYEREAYNRFYYSQAAGAVMRHLQSFSR